MIDLKQPIAAMQKLWGVLRHLPGGKWVFSKLLGFFIPYTGSISPYIADLEPGNVRVVLHDRRAVRNHLNSIHAIALANLGEAATGLGVTTTLPPDWRAILTNISVTYLKKARGTLTAVCRFPVPATFESGDVNVNGEILNASGEVVATVQAVWRIGPNRT